MSMANKVVVVGSFILMFLAFIGGFFAIGLLQTSERIGTSGIVVQPAPPPTPPPPPPEPSINIDVFCDRGCSVAMSEVDWGSLKPGGSIERTLFIRNSGEHPVLMTLMTDNWSPVLASDYFSLSWDYDGSKIEADQIVEVIMVLDVSSSISGINDFNFDIVLYGSAV